MYLRFNCGDGMDVYRGLASMRGVAYATTDNQDFVAAQNGVRLSFFFFFFSSFCLFFCVSFSYFLLFLFFCTFFLLLVVFLFFFCYFLFLYYPYPIPAVYGRQHFVFTSFTLNIIRPHSLNSTCLKFRRRVF